MNQVGQGNIVNNGSRGVILYSSSFHASVAIIKLQLAMLVRHKLSKDITITAGARASLLKLVGVQALHVFYLSFSKTMHGEVLLQLF